MSSSLSGSHGLESTALSFRASRAVVPTKYVHVPAESAQAILCISSEATTSVADAQFPACG
jgi:hypothetical protein